MQGYHKSLVPTIEACYENFTDTEKHIADYFLQDELHEEISSRILAKKLSVSEAALSRFSQKCGYSGYREFCYEYKNTFIDKANLTNSESITVINTYQKLLNKIYNLVDLTQIHRVSLYMKKSKQVFICGRGSSGLVAEEMTTRFRWVGVNTLFHRDNENMKMQTVFINEKDCIIGISLSGTKTEILYMLERGHRQGAKTVLITERKRAEYEDFCDEVLLVPSLARLNQGNLISPQFPVLLVSDLIYADYVSMDKKRIEELQLQIQEALNE